MEKRTQSETLAQNATFPAVGAEGEGAPENARKLNPNRPKIPEPQDLGPPPAKTRADPAKPRGGAQAEPAKPPRRRRGQPPKAAASAAAGPLKRRRRCGGQPGNTNAVKTNAHGREVRAARARRREIRRYLRAVDAYLAKVNAYADRIDARIEDRPAAGPKRSPPMTLVKAAARADRLSRVPDAKAGARRRVRGVRDDRS